MLIAAHQYLKTEFPLCYSNRSEQSRQSESYTENRNIDWNDLIGFAADYQIGDLTITEQTNAYRLMNLLNQRFKWEKYCRDRSKTK